MEKFKQNFYKLENEVAELKLFQTKIQGSSQSNGNIHYCASSQEFGEYDLDEIDTFRFNVTVSIDGNKIHSYIYNLLNPTPELTAYLNTQAKIFNMMSHIPIGIEDFEKYCMEKSGTPFVLTTEIKKCLDSKLWEFAGVSAHDPKIALSLGIRPNFYIDIPILFNHTYTISPHVSFYITPISPVIGISISIHELTTKQVIFRVNYDAIRGKNITGLKLHYSINGIVKSNDDNLLE
jgi:hypothetical protein